MSDDDNDDDNASAYASSQISVSDDEWDPDAAPKSGKKRSLPAATSAGKGKKAAAAGGGGRSSSSSSGGGGGVGGRSKKSAAAKDPKIHDAHTFSIEEVMAAVHALKATMSRKAAASSSSGGGGASGRGANETALSLGITGALEVRELAPPEVMASIEKLVVAAAERILGGEPYELSVPSRTAANQVGVIGALRASALFSLVIFVYAEHPYTPLTLHTVLVPSVGPPPHTPPPPMYKLH
jgi:hypothetical protein